MLLSYKNSGEILNRTHNYRDRLLGELWAVIGRCAVEDWLRDSPC